MRWWFGHRLAHISLICIAVILLDQSTKVIFADSIILNSGISFGWLSEWNPTFGAAMITLLLAAMVWFGRQWWLIHPIPSGLLLGGGVSNLLDRWFLGGVRDWGALPVVNLRNNIADYAITIGVIWFIYAYFTDSDHIV